MAASEVAVQIEGLGKIDLLELQEALPPGGVKLHTLDAPEDAYGEPGTVLALIAAGTLLLPPVLLWLAKRRWGFSLKEEESVTLPDGTVVQRRIHVTVRKSAPPTAAEIQALGKLKGVDLKAIAEALGMPDAMS